jgi:AcrR family transcriptional regulator
MVRHYNSSRRQKAAEQTRRDILRAALKLHWEGVTEYDPLAREAGCSVATVRKHFPTKEDLFRSCTRTFAETIDMPDLEALAKIPDADVRMRTAVRELCRIHAAMFGYAWLSEKLRGESPTLDGEMTAYSGLTDAIADLIAPADSPFSGLVRGLLDFLTYRALRLSGQLAAEDAADALSTALAPLTMGRE